jgi:hypothetical protein
VTPDATIWIVSLGHAIANLIRSRRSTGDARSARAR